MRGLHASARGSYASFFSASDTLHMMSPCASPSQSPKRRRFTLEDVAEESIGLEDGGFGRAADDSAAFGAGRATTQSAAKRSLLFSPPVKPTVADRSPDAQTGASSTAFIVNNLTSEPSRSRPECAAKSSLPYSLALPQGPIWTDAGASPCSQPFTVEELHRLEQTLQRREEAYARSQREQEEQLAVLRRQQDSLQLERDRLTTEKDELDTNRKAFLLDRIHSADVELMLKEQALAERERLLLSQQNQVASEKDLLVAKAHNIESNEKRNIADREEHLQVLAEKEAELEKRESRLVAREHLTESRVEVATQTPLCREPAKFLPVWCRRLLFLMIMSSVLLLVMGRLKEKVGCWSWTDGKSAVGRLLELEKVVRSRLNSAMPVRLASSPLSSLNSQALGGRERSVYAAACPSWGTIQSRHSSSLPFRLASTPASSRLNSSPFATENRSTLSGSGPLALTRTQAHVGTVGAGLAWVVARQYAR